MPQVEDIFYGVTVAQGEKAEIRVKDGLVNSLRRVSVTAIDAGFIEINAIRDGRAPATLLRQEIFVGNHDQFSSQMIAFFPMSGGLKFEIVSDGKFSGLVTLCVESTYQEIIKPEIVKCEFIGYIGRAIDLE